MINKKLISIFLIISFLLIPVFSQGDAIEKNTEFISQNSELIELLGPIAPIAYSPFFGIALTSAYSILASKGIIGDENGMLASNPFLNNWIVFVAFLLLSIFTALPKMTKTSSQIGLVAQYVEDKAGLVIVLIMQLIPILSGTPTGEIEPMSQAGFAINTITLFAIFSAINYYVLQVVRYFFDFLIFLSPIPLIDAAFEIGKKLLVVALLAIYAFSPYLSFVLNILMFAAALSIFFWAQRRLIYLENIFIKPVFNTLLNIQENLASKKLPQTIKNKHQNIQFALPVFLMKGTNGIKRKAKCWLVCDSGSLTLYEHKLFTQAVEINVSEKYRDLKLGKSLFFMQIFIKDDNFKLHLSNSYAKHAEKIATLGSLEFVGKIGVAKLEERFFGKQGKKPDFSFV